MSETVSLPLPASAGAYEFPSLNVLKEAHYRLLDAESAAEEHGAAAPEFLQEVRSFTERVGATGRILEGDDRGAAQTLLNYWATVLIRAGQAENLTTSLLDHDETSSRELDDSQCPYRGTEAHSAETVHLFFGRERLVLAGTKLLAEKKLLVIYGPAGAGKASLIRAGLAPAFLASRPAEAAWTPVETGRPGEDPSTSLEVALQAAGKSNRVLLTILRYDEALRFCPKNRRDNLLRMLGEWLAAPEFERRAIAASRSDAASMVQGWQAGGLLEPVAAELTVPPFQAVELRAVIEEPAKNIGLRFDEGLVETLVNEVLGEPAALALLQFTLLRLWEGRERNRITWANYKKIGGVQFAIESVAESVYLSLPPPDRLLTERFFPKLVRPSLTRELLVCSVPMTQLAETADERARVLAIVDRFVQQRLLRVRPSLAPGGEPLVEVAHEVVLRKWPRLERWLDVARLGLLERERIANAAAAWRENGRERCALWGGAQLGNALAILDQLPPAEQEFVLAGQAWAQRQRRRIRVALTALFLIILGWGLREKDRSSVEHALSRDHEVTLNLERAERLVERGDPAGAFLLFQSAYQTDLRRGWKPLREWFSWASWRHLPGSLRSAVDPDDQRMHDFRIGSTWPQLPHLAGLYSLSNVAHSDLSPDGRFLVGISGISAMLWRLDGDERGGAGTRLALPAASRVQWAAFHPDPQQPLVAIPVALPTSDPAGQGGEVLIFDADRAQPAAYPRLRIMGGVPQKAWFAPSAAGSLILVLAQSAQGGASEISVWDFHSGVRVAGPLQRSRPINWAAFSPNGELVATAGGDLATEDGGEIQIWGWRQNQQALLPHTGGPVAYVEFSATGDRLVTAEGADESLSGAARVWKVQPAAGAEPLQARAITAPLNYRGAVRRAHFSPDGQWVAAGSRDRTARVWHIATQKAVLSFSHEGDVNEAVFSPDGRFLATGSRDRTAALWEIATGQRLLPPLDHAETVTELAFLPDGRRLLTTAKNLVRSWDLDRREPKVPILGSRESWLVTATADGQRFCTVSASEGAADKLELWETSSGHLLASTPLPNRQHLYRAALNADGTRIALAMPPLAATPATPEAPGKPGKPADLQVYAYNPAETGTLRVVPAQGTQKWQGQEVALLAFDPAHERLAVALRDPLVPKKSTVALYEWATGRVVPLPRSAPVFNSVVQFSPRGDFLLSCFTRPGDETGFGWVWPLQGSAPGEPSQVQHESDITTADFSPDGRSLLTGSTDDTARLWPIEGGRVLAGRMLLSDEQKDEDGAAKRGAHTHTADVTEVLFSHDGRRAITAAKDQTALLWNMKGAPRRIAVLQHGARVNDASFDQNDAMVLTSSEEPKLRVWSASNGKLIALFTPLGEVLQSGFAPNGESLFAIGQTFANQTPQSQNPTTPAGEQPVTREVRPMTWSLQSPHRILPGTRITLPQMASLGQLIAARTADKEGLAKMPSEQMAPLWQQQKATYAALFSPPREPQRFHAETAAECEATEQWSAAAWHFSHLLALHPDQKETLDLLARRANAYAVTDDRLVDLPKSIADREKLVELQPQAPEAYRELAEVRLAYGTALPDATAGRAEFDRAIAALEQARKLNPTSGDYPLLLAEARAGERNFNGAAAELDQALARGNRSAPARLAFVNWLSDTPEGKEKYRTLCQSLLDPKTSPPVAYSLLWPTVLTNEFSGPEHHAFNEEVVALARRKLAEAPANLYRRNTLGAALFRAGHYEEALKELGQARDAYLAERVNALTRHYDQLIRVPLWRPAEGRPQDWLFLAMACAKLYASDPQGQISRQTEMWDWMRKAMDDPQLARVRDQRPNSPGRPSQPVLYATLAVEALYREAYALLREVSTSPTKPAPPSP